jgi:hypothetical protein
MIGVHLYFAKHSPFLCILISIGGSEGPTAWPEFVEHFGEGISYNYNGQLEEQGKDGKVILWSVLGTLIVKPRGG